MAEVELKVTTMNNVVFKINVPDREEYRHVINVLRECKKDVYAYE